MMRLLAIPVLLVSLLHGTDVVWSDDMRIVADLETFFMSDDSTQRRDLVRRIESDPAFDRDRMSDWLHRMDRYGDEPSGAKMITVPIDHGLSRDVLIRIPDGYDPDRPWP